MGNKKDLLIRVIGGSIIIILLTIIAIRKPHSMVSEPIIISKEDSLQNVINQLQIDLESEQDGWDDKEKRYEQVLFEYEFGIDYLKHYHNDAYKDFHRIVGYKEYFTHDLERENKKRMKPTGGFKSIN